MKDRIVILGGAESGVGAAILARQQGYAVFVSDSGSIADKFRKELGEQGIEFEESGHSMDQLRKADLVVKSPGVPDQAAVVKRLRQLKKSIISEIEFAYRYKGSGKILAVTGTNGKTTTTTMLYEMLREQGMDVAVAGNIGYSFARQIATDPRECYVLEVSSFQLDDIVSFRPDVAILTNITEDHMDRYDHRFENYIRSKFNIMRNQQETDLFIYNQDDEEIMKNMDKYLNHVKTFPISMQKVLPLGAFVKDQEMHLAFDDEEVIMSVDDFRLKGRHNLYNSMAAASAARAVGVKKENIRQSLISIKAIAHRTQFVATIGGIDFINDSKATNINSTWYALESLTKPVILILGGVDKGNDYRILNDLVKEKVRAIVCLGVSNEKIHRAFEGIVEKIVDTSSAEEAVETSYRLAEKGDIVLLSPACASFDLFDNYEDRGEKFIKAVKNL